MKTIPQSVQEVHASFQEMGLREAYVVVGNNMNCTNPGTGMLPHVAIADSMRSDDVNITKTSAQHVIAGCVWQSTRRRAGK